MNASIYPITITTATKATQEENGDYHVPKKDLVAVMMKVMETGRLPIVPGLAHAGTLTKEMQNFTARITKAANEVFSAREGQHDDLVLAVALAVWAGENLFIGEWDATPNPRAQSMGLRPPHGVFLTDHNRDDDGPRRGMGSVQTPWPW